MLVRVIQKMVLVYDSQKLPAYARIAAVPMQHMRARALHACMQIVPVHPRG